MAIELYATNRMEEVMARNEGYFLKHLTTSKAGGVTEWERE